jgi:hypothetical protein
MKLGMRLVRDLGWFGLFSASTALAQPAKQLPQFQCMSLTNLWNGEGPMPPPVNEFASPRPDAPSVGTAMSTVVVDKPVEVRNGRVRVVRPNGQVAWIDQGDIATWHVVSNPTAKCSVVQLANGSIGTTSHR